MQALVEPAIVLLRKSGVIGMNENFVTLEEDILRYHLRTVKKEMQVIISGAAMFCEL